MATSADYAEQEQAFETYFREGAKRAAALENRGPLRLTPGGALHPEIVAAYDHYGFYVVDGLLSSEELAELQAAYVAMANRLPSVKGSNIDRAGRPALGVGLELPAAYWCKPLSDPSGGTARLKGRSPVKMFEPKPSADLPDEVVSTIVGPLQHSDAFLRLYGHPDLLRISASINGEDFVPFQEGIIIKRPGEGRSFAWHQDGATHWSSPDWNQHSHGINIMIQLYGSTPANGVWFVPGTHALGQVDIKQLVDRAGSERLPGAVPLVCGPGEVAISNRQILHGSFANTSPDSRVTVSIGFHPRRFVLGATGYVGETNEPITFDADWIRKRSEIIGYAIDARRQYYPGEVPFVYRPHRQSGVTLQWNEAARHAIRDYNRFDIRI